MAGQTSSILKGFDYQHLLSWYHILSLKTNDDIIGVKLENALAGSVDDLTVEKKDGSIDFYQIKYHVKTGHYSITDLLTGSDGPSLMEKFWTTWNKLVKLHAKEKIRLILYSNWVNHQDDQILKCLDGENGQLGETFFKATPKSSCGKQRSIWQKKHSANDEDFNDFTRAIAFQLGRNFTAEVRQMIGDRMQLCGLKHDQNAMLVAIGIIKDWIKEKKDRITLSLLEEKIQKHDLYLPVSAEKSASIYFVTVKNRRFDLAPDYVLDWRHYFKEVSGIGSHELIDATNWNKALLPELRSMEDKINSTIAPRLIRARGFARLSAWFAFGHAFSDVSGYIVEVSQQDKLWRTDESPNSGFKVISENGDGEIIDTGNKVVAIGISVTGSLVTDVRKYLLGNSGVDALLLLRPETDLGQDCFQAAGDVAAFARQVKSKIREFVKVHQAEKVLLFYFGPLSGACFIGHQLNAICKEIQIMENVAGGYMESFSLS